MKILSVKNEKNSVVFAIQLDLATWKKDFANAKKNIAKNISIPGFRKGKVPANIIDERITPAQVAYEALDKNQHKYIGEIVKAPEFEKANCIDAVNNLTIDKLDADKSAPELKISFDAVPEVNGFSMKDVKDIVVPPFKSDIPEALVKSQIKMMIRNDAMIAQKEGAIAKGDIAVIDFKGFVDNKPFEGGQGKNYELEIGSKSFVDNFEDQLIGLKKGDKKDVNVTFPKEYHKDLAGKKAKFEVEVKDVKSIEYPTINKEYLKKFNIDANNEKELADYIKNLFKQENEVRYNDMCMRIINAEIAKKAKLSYYPISLVDMHKQQVLRQYEQEAQRSGFKTLNAYKKALKLDDKAFNDLVEKSSKSCLDVAMAYEKLIEEYKLNVEKADMDDYLAKLAKYMGDEAKAKEAIEKNKDYVESTVVRDKLFKKMIAEAKKEEPKKPEVKKEATKK